MLNRSCCPSSNAKWTISTKLCSSISYMFPIKYLFITISLQFGAAHGLALLCEGQHQGLHMNQSCKHIRFHFRSCHFSPAERFNWGMRCVKLGGGNVLFWGVGKCQFEGWKCVKYGGVEMCQDEVIHNHEYYLKYEKKTPLIYPSILQVLHGCACQALNLLAGRNLAWWLWSLLWP